MTQSRPRDLRIVVGVDLDEPSLVAARWIAEHFGTAAELVLVHAVFVPEPPAFLRGLYPANDQLVEDARRGAEARLEELAASLDSPRTAVEVRVGRPDDCLVQAAIDRQAALIVVGPHGERPGVWKLLGSTAERVVRRAPMAVLLARGLRASPRRVLLALDESEAHREVLAWGARLQRQFEASVVAMHVVNPLQHGAALVAAAHQEREKAEGQLRERATAWVTAEAGAAGVTEPLVHVAFGDPGFEVLSAISRFGASLAVAGRHGADGTMGMLVGGVPEFLLRNGTGPVLIVQGA